MIKEAIVKIVNKEDLSYTEAYTVMNEIMNGETSPTQNAAFLAALSTKSARAETTEEIAGCAAAMRAHAIQVDTGMDVFEIVGTGGDHAHSFNISTTSALVAAAGGRKLQNMETGLPPLNAELLTVWKLFRAELHWKMPGSPFPSYRAQKVPKETPY